MRITVVFDNRVLDGRLLAGHGFSCLVELGGRRILFDAGGDAARLFYNMGVLGVDPRSIHAIVVSHYHWDHVGGLQQLLYLNPGVAVYLPTCSSKPMEVAPGAWTTGPLETVYRGERLFEQALVIDLGDGIAVITGCSHPGVEAFVGAARAVFRDRRVRVLIGGWHLMEAGAREALGVLNRLGSLGAETYAPCHCIDDKGVELARRVLGERLAVCGVGLEIEL